MVDICYNHATKSIYISGERDKKLCNFLQTSI